MDTRTLEYRILSLMRRRDAYLKYSSVIKEGLFESKESKYIYRLIAFYHKNKRAKDVAPLSSLFTLVNTKVKEGEAEKYLEIIRKIKKFPLVDLSIAETVVKNFAKRQILKLTVIDAVKSLDREDDLDIVKLREKLDEALAIDSTDLLEEAYDYFTNPRKRLKEEKEEPRIATLLSPELDKAMRRGLAAGEIGIVVAPTSVGKTMFLLNIAYNAIKQGKKVVYVTLELNYKKIASRIDQLVSRKPYEFITSNSEFVWKKMKRLLRFGGGLRIKDVTANRFSPNELGVYLERLHKNFPFDMIIVDQVDLMYSPKEYKERRHELSSIVVSLRRLGATFKVPVWAASQATRIAGAAGKTTLWDIAEDIGKANWADVILTLSQDKEDKEENIMFVEMAKNRIGEGNPTIMLPLNYKFMLIKPGIAIHKKARKDND